MTDAIGTLSSIMIQVDDMDDACEFYGDVMGFKLKFRDGDRWAAFDAGSVTLALAARDELPERSLRETSALNVKVANVDLATQRSLWGGARLVTEMITTAHETRSTVQDPSGRLINFYSPNKQ
jgi:predicted enzyme related to lactoylglutathione lyase